MAFSLACKPTPSPPLQTILKERQNLTPHHLKQIHGHLFRRCLHHDTILITKLISSVSSSLLSASYAARIFDSLPEPDIVLCNAILRLYIQASFHEHAISFYAGKVLARRLSPNERTFPYVSKACVGVSDVELARQVHASVAKSAGVCKDVVVLNSLMDMYFKCGRSDDGIGVFGTMEGRDSTSWNTMMAGLVSSGELEMARKLFDEMPQRDVVSWNTLVSAHAKAGEMETARDLFDRMPERSLVSWNALVSGYSQNGRHDQALLVFSRMLEAGIKPDCTTILPVLSACASAQSPDGLLVKKIISLAKSMASAQVSTALLSLYVKVGRIDDARRVFDEIPEKDLVSWNAMIAGYSQNQRPARAIELFRLMRKPESRVNPDTMTMVSLIDPCSQMGVLSLGEWLHSFIQKNKIKSDIFLKTSLIDMYAKCGDLNRSRLLFSEMQTKHLTSWNAMINALAINGNGNEALDLFSSMEKNGIVPNDVTYIGLLNACSHGGLVDKGLHPRSDEIYAAIDALMEKLKLKGYKPDTGALLRNLDEEAKEEALFSHSEKLALCFALISSDKEKLSPIRIVKNLRICSDCHRVMELVSQLEKREIIVRDRCRFHHFHGGSCSCGGYW
ncbi:hypothetical protein J5N97_018135 [Dioscorea zingiberensis]|uniref:DYW domain-containing protein n=1 Tax=Dioscorea zingiberensis TaxID=325984 RepID=A0A9D5HH08_9LILI|nr:hypothetical protein J5N97_018135 [Dioscorea zingiberensis]